MDACWPRTTACKDGCCTLSCMPGSFAGLSLADGEAEGAELVWPVAMAELKRRIRARPKLAGDPDPHAGPRGPIRGSPSCACKHWICTSDLDIPKLHGDGSAIWTGLLSIQCGIRTCPTQPRQRLASFRSGIPFPFEIWGFQFKRSISDGCCPGCLADRYKCVRRG